MTALEGAIAVSAAGALPWAARRGLNELGERITPDVRDIVGLGTGAIAAAWYAWRGPESYGILCASLIVSVITDIRKGVVLDLVVGATIVLLGLSAWANGTLPAFALGMAAVALVMLAIFVLARGGIGAGDVKLAAVLGGALGAGAGLAALALAFVAGGVVASVALATGRARRDTAIPFAPYVALGAAITIALRSVGLAV